MRKLQDNDDQYIDEFQLKILIGLFAIFLVLLIFKLAHLHYQK